MTGHTLVYFGAGWDFEPVVDHIYENLLISSSSMPYPIYRTTSPTRTAIKSVRIGDLSSRL